MLFSADRPVAPSSFGFNKLLDDLRTRAAPVVVVARRRVISRKSFANLLVVVGVVVFVGFVFTPLEQRRFSSTSSSFSSSSSSSSSSPTLSVPKSFDPTSLASALRQTLHRPGLDLRAFVRAYRLVCLYSKATLGRPYEFAGGVLEETVDLVEEGGRNASASGANETVEGMMDFELDRFLRSLNPDPASFDKRRPDDNSDAGLLRKPTVVSRLPPKFSSPSSIPSDHLVGSVNLQHLQRLLEFLFHFGRRLFEVPKTGTSASACRLAYEASYARRHTWLVRTGAKLAMTALLPSREAMMSPFKVDGRLEVGKQIFEDIEKIWRKLTKMFEERGMGEIARTSNMKGYYR